MPFLHCPALSDALCLARRHVLISFPLANPLLIHPPRADFLPGFPTLYLIPYPALQLILPSPCPCHALGLNL